ncbi:MAG TPA: 2-hydroxyacid dehydrogenase [Methylomirabilota bacterium]|nr:2-hydroxyacid dehydrogenase [Methylomirabilota bacterium]
MAVPVLITGTPNRFIRAAAEAAFEVHDLCAAADREALLRDVGPRIRGIVNCGATPKDLMDRLPALEIVSHFGVGYDPIDVRAAAARGIVVTNTPEVLTEEVADTAFGLLLMTVRELSAAERWLRAGNWVSKGPYPLTRGSLRNRTMGILGYGRIGQAIARRGEACGLKIAYHSRRPVEGAEHPYYVSAKALAAAVDILMIVLPGGAATQHLVEAAVIEALGPEGVLINVGRGSVLDEAALVAALEAGKILGAGLDVFESEPEVHPGLMKRDDVVLLPHVASASEATRGAMAALQLENLVAWFEGRRPPTPVPETPLPTGR